MCIYIDIKKNLFNNTMFLYSAVRGFEIHNYQISNKMITKKKKKKGRLLKDSNSLGLFWNHQTSLCHD